MCNVSDVYCTIIIYAKLKISVEMNPKPKKLLDRVRDTIRLKQNSNKTEGAYLNWIKQYILFHDKKHPQCMGASKVEAFLTYLVIILQAVRRPGDHQHSGWIFVVTIKPIAVSAIRTALILNRVLSKIIANSNSPTTTDALYPSIPA